MMALALTMTDKPMAVNMSFQREYAERYEWMKQQFIDWAFTYINSFLYYEDYDTLNDETRQMMQQSMAAFGGIAPTYHIALLDKPTIVWDFHSLLLGVQMMFSFMLTDSENPIKLCRHCTKAFVASRPSAVFCSPQCKNKHNVYKSRARKNSGSNWVCLPFGITQTLWILGLLMSPKRVLSATVAVRPPISFIPIRSSPLRILRICVQSVSLVVQQPGSITVAFKMICLWMMV